VNERYSIPNPCTKQKWADMEGNGRARLCRECCTLVHNIEAYSEAEWERLWRASGGKVCGMRGGESPREVRSRRSVLAGVLLTAISPLMAQDRRLVLVALDPAGAVVAGVKVELLDKDGKILRANQTNQVGEVVWTDLPIGDSTFRFSINGFKSKSVNVMLIGVGEKRVEVKLDVSAEVEGGAVTEEHPIVGEFLGPKKQPKKRWWKFLK
jgi:hypothetical protein